MPHFYLTNRDGDAMWIEATNAEAATGQFRARAKFPDSIITGSGPYVPEEDVDRRKEDEEAALRNRIQLVRLADHFRHPGESPLSYVEAVDRAIKSDELLTAVEAGRYIDSHEDIDSRSLTMNAWAAAWGAWTWARKGAAGDVEQLKAAAEVALDEFVDMLKGRGSQQVQVWDGYVGWRHGHVQLRAAAFTQEQTMTNDCNSCEPTDDPTVRPKPCPEDCTCECHGLDEQEEPEPVSNLKAYLTAAAKGQRGWRADYDDAAVPPRPVDHIAGFDAELERTDHYNALAGHYAARLDELIAAVGGPAAVLELLDARERVASILNLGPAGD